MFRWCQTLIFVVLWAVPGLARTSIMQQEWQIHAGMVYDTAPKIVIRRLPMMRGPKEVRRLQVMGYLPYWNEGKTVLYTDTLSILAYFGVSCNSDGSLNSAHHWGTASLQGIIDLCHEHGIRVVLTVTNFKASSMQAILQSSTARRNLVNNLVNLVVKGGGDGVNVDFEGLPKAVKSQFVDFMDSLKQAMEARVPNSHVSIATPAIDWSGAFDYDRLAEVTDALFIMGYDYHWSKSNPGPVSPLKGGGIWGKYSLEWTINDYITYGDMGNRNHFILGLPLYGYDWACSSSTVPGTRVSGTKAEPVIWKVTQQEAQDGGGWKWDQSSETVFYMYREDHLHQVWGDNLQSMQKKLDLALDKDIGGVGFWALGYANDQKLWEQVHRAAFSPVAGGDDEADEADNAVDDAAGGDRADEAEEVVKQVMDNGYERDTYVNRDIQTQEVHTPDTHADAHHDRSIPDCQDKGAEPLDTGSAEIRLPTDAQPGPTLHGKAKTVGGSCGIADSPITPWPMMLLLLLLLRRWNCSH